MEASHCYWADQFEIQSAADSFLRQNFEVPMCLVELVVGMLEGLPLVRLCLSTVLQLVHGLSEDLVEYSAEEGPSVGLNGPRVTNITSVAGVSAEL